MLPIFLHSEYSPQGDGAQGSLIIDSSYTGGGATTLQSIKLLCLCSLLFSVVYLEALGLTYVVKVNILQTGLRSGHGDRYKSGCGL